MAQWDSNSQPKDDPFSVSLDNNNSQIHRENGVKPTSVSFYDVHGYI